MTENQEELSRAERCSEETVVTDERAAAAAPAGTSLGLSIVRLGRVPVLSAECVAKDKGQRSNTPLCLHIQGSEEHTSELQSQR